MKKAFRFLLIIIAVLVIIVVGAATYVSFFLPNVGKPEDIKVEATPARIERGNYLAHSVMVCMDCHSQRDWTKYAGPLVPGTEGRGGEKFDQHFGFPGVFYSRNITPAGIGKWTDGELFRAITTGVNKDGKALFPIMPYHYYGQLDKEDIYSIIAYIRSLKPIENEIPNAQPDFPFSIIEHTIPHKANLKPRPAESDSVAYGKYLVTAASCVECHTRVDKGQIIAGLEFSGGREFALPAGTLRSANITPHEDGLKSWTEEQFVRRFKQYQDSSYQSPVIGKKDFNTLMPWMMYSTMKESDLRSIYQYLRTIKPLPNKVEKFTANKS
ncbi:MAG: c-type cytochrome [Bacteroidota bacterium]|nr:c-type cytochrome [Bacteroidota bacterium]